MPPLEQRRASPTYDLPPPSGYESYGPHLAEGAPGWEAPIYEGPLSDGPVYGESHYGEPVYGDEQYLVPDVVMQDSYLSGGPYDVVGPDGVLGPEFCGPFWMNYQAEYFGGFSTMQDPLGGRDFASAGFQEGLLIGGPLSPYHGSGFELGLRGVHTNLAGYGSDVVDSGGGRNQLYLTAGVYRRPHYGSGLQGGAAWDWLVDDYLVDHQTSRVRAEISYLSPLAWEFGFWGSGDVSSVTRSVGGANRKFEAIDVYAMFVRRQMGPIRNRGWLGLTDDGQVILGGESRLPLGPSWALGLEGSRLFADGRRGPDAAAREGWALGVTLVFAPRAGVMAPPTKYTPVFGVAGPSNYYTRAGVVAP